MRSALPSARLWLEASTLVALAIVLVRFVSPDIIYCLYMVPQTVQEFIPIIRSVFITHDAKGKR